MSPLVSYYGGKQRMACKIVPLIPDHKVYCEPFFGGGAVFFKKGRPNVTNDCHYREVINDHDQRLITLYRVMQDPLQSAELIDRLQFTPYSQAEYWRAVDMCKELQFSITEEGLLLNNVGVEQKNPLAKTFVQHLNAREIRNFSIVKGLTYEKFCSLVDVFNEKPDDIRKSGGFATVLSKSGIEGVRAAKISYVQVSEDDVVISKDTLEETIGDNYDVDRVMDLLRKGKSVSKEDKEAPLSEWADERQHPSAAIPRAGIWAGKGDS